MKLVIGGAYQGKLDYALTHLAPGASVYRGSLTEPEIDFSCEIVYQLHLTLLARQRNELDTIDYARRHLPELSTKIIICDDITCGVVPVEPEMRLWRENVGQTLVLLAQHADEVIRIFCGMAKKIQHNTDCQTRE